MDDTVCYEYLCGFCTRTEFFVENITEKCNLPHVDAEVPEESLKEKAASVLGHYMAVSREVDRKVDNNTYLLSMKSGVYDAMDAIDHLQREMIRMCDMQVLDIDQMKMLLRIHGLAIEAARGTGSDEAPYSVCKTCSFFYRRDGACEHPLHEKYRKLRKAADRLQKMLKG